MFFNRKMSVSNQSINQFPLKRKVNRTDLLLNSYNNFDLWSNWKKNNPKKLKQASKTQLTHKVLLSNNQYSRNCPEKGWLPWF